MKIKYKNFLDKNLNRKIQLIIKKVKKFEYFENRVVVFNGKTYFSKIHE
jgi:hypothetical protein